MKDNTLSETFDLEEHPDVRFRECFIKDNDDEVCFVQADARLVPLIALSQPLLRVRDFEEILVGESYFGRILK